MEKAVRISDLYKEINGCEKCNLYKQRIKNYIWSGNPGANIVLIGEAPGADEQEQGTFFIGRSGKLLRKLLNQAGINDKEDVYITNIVKDRPPENRNPFWDEIKACMPFLLEELRIINPKLIITLGKVSGNWFANGRGWEWNTYYKERRWLALWHPSYLLRRRDLIVSFIEALKKTLDELNL